jgi:nitrite reductase (NADH) small subunit
MSEFLAVAVADAVPAGEARVYTVAGTAVAVFNVGGAHHAIANACPHVGGPLGEGSIQGSVVTCPWHSWSFDVTTGCLQRPSNTSVARYAVKVEAGKLLVGCDPL